MKSYLLLLIFLLSITDIIAQKAKNNVSMLDSTKKIWEVETACGECQFKLPGSSCDLAVRINGKAYFVDGTTIDEHGDAHAKDGFCNSVRKATVQGSLMNNRFSITYFKLQQAEINPSKK